MNAFYCRRAVDMFEERCRMAPRQRRRTYALADAKPHFAPDRPCDIVHIALTLYLDIAQQTIKGTCAWNETIRNGVFRGLADLQDESAIPLLPAFTAYGKPPMARYAAIRALGKLGGEKDPAPAPIIETLTAILDAEHFRTRMAILNAMESLHSPKTLPTLEGLRARDLDGRVKRRVEEVIEAIRSERKQTNEVQQLRDDFQAMRDENKKLLERLDRLEARQTTGTSA